MATTTMNLQFSAPAVEIGTSGNPSFAVDIVGFSPYTAWEGPEQVPGTLRMARDGTIWEFGKATAAVTVASPAITSGMSATTPPTPVACAFDPATGLISAGAGYKRWGSIAVGQYGWVVRDGTGV